MNDSADQAKQRLWVVSEPYYPEETSTGFYMTRIAEGLADDFDVHALCGQPNYSARGVTAPKQEVHNGVRIFRAWGTRLDKNVIPFRLINIATVSLSIFLKALFKIRKGDRVLVVTTPPTLPFVIAAASLIKGASYVLLIHDNYPEILIAAGKATHNSLSTKALNFANRWLYKYASKMIVVGRDMKELVEKKTAGLDVPIATIPNWAELEILAPAPRETNPLLAEMGIADKLVFLYAGNMGYPNDIESIIECAERLKGRDSFEFVFLGAGVKRAWLERAKREKQLENVTILDPRPRSEQQVFLNACDVAFVSLVPSMWGVSMPSRTYNILAVGKPILALAEAGSEVARVVTDDDLGWVVPPNSPDELYSTLLEIEKERDTLAARGERARKVAVEQYSLASAISKYRRELRY